MHQLSAIERLGRLVSFNTVSSNSNLDLIASVLSGHKGVVPVEGQEQHRPAHGRLGPVLPLVPPRYLGVNAIFHAAGCIAEPRRSRCPALR